MKDKFDSKPNKNKWIAYDDTGKIVAMAKDIDIILDQAEQFNHFKRDYGVRVYPILRREDKLFI